MPIALPNITATIRAAGVTAGLTPEKLLIVGSMLSGSATSGALVSNILADGAEDDLFGAASPVAAAIRRARRRNGVTQIDAIGVADNGSATSAAGAVVFTGTATAAGTVTVYVGSKKYNKYELAIAVGDTATVIGGKLVTAITADARALVTAVNTTGSVALTAKNGGTVGNTIGVKYVGVVAGVSTALTAMSGGATDPVLVGVLDVVGATRYQGIVWQFTNDLDEVADFLAPRFNASNNVLDGRAFAAITDTYSNHLATLGALNSRDLCVQASLAVNDATHKGPAILELPFVQAAEFAAVRALRRTDGAQLGGVVISRASRDSTGGPWTNSKPYFNTPLADLELPDAAHTFTDVEVAGLKAAGGYVLDANRARTAVIAGEVVTTYKTDAAGNPDPTFTYLNYVDTATAVREYIVNNTRAQYPQYRATGGALPSGVDAANEASVATFVTQLYAALGDLALVNTGTGTIEGEAVDYDKLFRENLIVTLNPVTGKFAVSARTYPVVQLRGVTFDLPIAFEV